MSGAAMGRPPGVVDGHQRPPRARPEKIVRDWLLVRRRHDGLKLRELAAEFGVSKQFAQQVVTRAEDLTFTWRSKHGVCRECGKGSQQ